MQFFGYDNLMEQLSPRAKPLNMVGVLNLVTREMIMGILLIKMRLRMGESI